MLHALFALILLAAPAPTTAPAEAAPPAPAATTQPAAAIVVPTTQSVAVLITPEQLADAQHESITEVFSKTRMGQLFEGKRKVTIDDVKNPVFWLDTIKDLVIAVVSFLPRVFVALIFLVFFWLIYRAIRKLVVGSMSKATVDPSIRDMLGWLIKWAIMGFGVVIACNQIGIQIAALLTGVSIIGLAVGFAAQETLANFIAGIVIFWDKPFKVGDWIEIDGVYAQVSRVTFRSTRLAAGNGDVVVMPNTTMLSTKLRNRTTNPMTQVKIEIGIAYKESIAAARAVLLATIDGDTRICPEPPPGVSVTACADSSVNLALSFWTKEEGLEGTLRGEYLEKAKNALDAAG